MYDDILKDVKIDLMEGTYSISMPRGLDESNMATAASFILRRVLMAATGKLWSVDSNILDRHISFNIRKAEE